jgi:hypothetical protein
VQAFSKQTLFELKMYSKVILVVEFQREGYKTRKVFGYKAIFQKEIIVFCELMQQPVVKK